MSDYKEADEVMKRIEEAEGEGIRKFNQGVGHTQLDLNLSLTRLNLILIS
jgi:hypothetical protein